MIYGLFCYLKLGEFVADNRLSGSIHDDKHPIMRFFVTFVAPRNNP